MKNLNNTAVSISQDLNVSDTYVHEVFMQYVDLPRLPLCTVLSIDEVHLRFDKNNLYALVLMNWETGEIIDPGEGDGPGHNDAKAFSIWEED